MPRYQAIFLSGDYFWKEKKISAHENRLFINIASPLKKKLTTIDPTTGPEGQLRAGGWRFFFFGGGGAHGFQGERNGHQLLPTE